MKAYKGFNSDMTCRGFRYQEGKEYEHNGEVKACGAGYHACEAPLDCFGYYAPSKSVFHEVELSGTTSSDTEDTKIAASHIKIGARLDIAGICKAQFDFVKSRCVNEHNSKPGNQPRRAIKAQPHPAANRHRAKMVCPSRVETTSWFAAA